MSWSKSWYLERRWQGKWHKDDRLWLPIDSPIELYYLSDSSPETVGLSAMVKCRLTERFQDGFPYDASVEVRMICKTFCLHQAEELTMLPTFGFLLLSNILSIDWSHENLTFVKKLAIEAWRRHLLTLGNPEMLRLIYMLWR